MNSNAFWTPIYEVRKNVEEQEADCYAYIQSLANPAYDIGMMASDEWGAKLYRPQEYQPPHPFLYARQ